MVTHPDTPYPMLSRHFFTYTPFFPHLHLFISDHITQRHQHKKNHLHANGKCLSLLHSPKACSHVFPSLPHLSPTIPHVLVLTIFSTPCSILITLASCSVLGSRGKNLAE